MSSLQANQLSTTINSKEGLSPRSSQKNVLEKVKSAQSIMKTDKEHIRAVSVRINQNDKEAIDDDTDTFDIGSVNLPTDFDEVDIDNQVIIFNSMIAGDKTSPFNREELREFLLKEHAEENLDFVVAGK